MVSGGCSDVPPHEMNHQTQQMKERRPVILLTGATGALGSALLPSLVRQFGQHEIVCIIRAASESDAARRLQAVAAHSGLHPDDIGRIRALPGDVALARFGLGEDAYRALAGTTEKIFHLAASVDFNASLEESRIANVDSTRHIVRFAKDCRHRQDARFRLNYVSTAYVAGNAKGRLKESALRNGQSFWNSYEQSKLEAEELAEAAKAEIPTTIYRPSQIIGDSRTGKIAKFFGFYEFIGLAVRGRSNVLVADAGARPDMVPSDYICDAILHFDSQDHAAGKTCHLAAGLVNSLTVNEVVDAVLEVFEDNPVGKKALARPIIISEDHLDKGLGHAELARYNASAQKLLMRTYQPYLSYERDFDVEETHRELERAGIRIPDMRQVVKITARYALSARTRQLSESIQ